MNQSGTNLSSTVPMSPSSSPPVSAANSPILLPSSAPQSPPDRPLSPPAIDEAEALKRAEQLKEEGNRFYKQQKYAESISFYERAIALCPQAAAFYGNRSAAYLMLKEYDQALRDCARATALDAQLVKCYRRAASILLMRGQLDAATEQLSHALSVDADDKDTLEQLGVVTEVGEALRAGERAVEAKLFKEARIYFAKAEQHITADTSLILKSAWVDIGLGDLAQAIRESMRVIRMDKSNGEAYYVRGVALFKNEHYDQAVVHFQECLKRDPDHRGASLELKALRHLVRLMEAGRVAVQKRQFAEAIPVFTELVDHDKTKENPKLLASMYAERGDCYFRLDDFQKCIPDETKAVYYNKELTRAYMMRSLAFKELKLFEKSLGDLEYVLTELDRNNGLAYQRYTDLKFEVRRMKRPNYYELLSIKKTSSVQEIKEGYRQSAMAWHPDRHSRATEEKRKEAEETFKRIQEGYEVLMDPFMKDLYDKGHDLDSIKEKVEAKKRKEQGGHDHYH